MYIDGEYDRFGMKFLRGQTYVIQTSRLHRIEHFESEDIFVRCTF